MEFVLIRKMSAGNDSVGEMWDETKIFDESATLKQVMDWAEDKHDRENIPASRKNITITRPHKQ